MMHRKNFVAAIRVGGKVLRESSERVELPFGAEYDVLLKNIDTVRMQAKIQIDGQEASGWLVLNPGEKIAVERFCKDNLESGNRFKFIERTAKVEEHRGVQAEDGLVRIEFKREKVAPMYRYTHWINTPYYYWTDRWSYAVPQWTTICNSSSSSGGLMKSASMSRGTVNNASFSGAITQQGQNFQCSSNDAGITVPGSLSDQKFYAVSDFETEPSEVMVLHLVGSTQKAPVKVAKTVNRKPKCVTCGKTNKGSSKFCTECGTSLERISA